MPRDRENQVRFWTTDGVRAQALAVSSALGLPLRTVHEFAMAVGLRFLSLSLSAQEPVDSHQIEELIQGVSDSLEG